MKQSYKILLMNAGIAVVITAFFILSDGGQVIASDVGVVFGLTCLGLGLLNLLVGFILVLIQDQRETGKALLISSAVLLLLSGISCGTALSNMRL